MHICQDILVKVGYSLTMFHISGG